MLFLVAKPWGERHQYWTLDKNGCRHIVAYHGESGVYYSWIGYGKGKAYSKEPVALPDTMDRNDQEVLQRRPHVGSDNASGKPGREPQQAQAGPSKRPINALKKGRKPDQVAKPLGWMTKDKQGDFLDTHVSPFDSTYVITSVSSNLIL